MFIDASFKFIHILALSVFLAAFGTSVVLSASTRNHHGNEPKHLERSLVDTLDILEGPTSSLVQGLTGSEDSDNGYRNYPHIPKVDKWVGRPLKQYNPHDAAEQGSKMMKKPTQYGNGDRTRYPYGKPSPRLMYPADSGVETQKTRPYHQ